MKKLLGIVLAGLAVGALLGITNLGSLLVLDKVAAVPTCAALYEGSQVRLKGGAGEGYTKVCYCVSDGAATPAYQWCSAQFAVGAATFTCTGGSTTVCP